MRHDGSEGEGERSWSEAARVGARGARVSLHRWVRVLDSLIASQGAGAGRLVRVLVRAPAGEGASPDFARGRGLAFAG